MNIQDNIKISKNLSDNLEVCIIKLKAENQGVHWRFSLGFLGDHWQGSLWWNTGYKKVQ